MDYNDRQQILRLTRELWEPAPGSANDISVAANGVPWIVLQKNKLNDEPHIYGWNGRGWDVFEGSMVGVAVDARGRPWAFDDQNRIFAHPQSLALKSK